MTAEGYIAKAEAYLSALCSVKPNRRTGSDGNWRATRFFENTIRSFGYHTRAPFFRALDHIDNGSDLRVCERNFEVYTSPYSVACDVNREMAVVSTVDDLESISCTGKILLMTGQICEEQLMPKNFVFYNPEHHQKIISLLENKSPAAVITATQKKPDQVGAVYPFPLIVDGDFDIPNAYCKDVVGAELLRYHGCEARLRVKAERVLSKARNVVASLRHEFDVKLVLTAHIDAYQNSPGASDNASGIAVLLLVGEMLSDYRGEYGIELVALNGEDHYSAGGQMDYLARYRKELPATYLAINIDDVGYRKGRSAYSFYGCPNVIEIIAKTQFENREGLCFGEQWFNGDHMIFVQNGVPCIAFTAEFMSELMRTITHTEEDTPDMVDCEKLVELAAALNDFIRTL